MSNSNQKNEPQSSAPSGNKMDFVSISALSSLKLLWTINRNFKPLFNVMDKTKDFDDFMNRFIGSSYEDIIKDLNS